MPILVKCRTCQVSLRLADNCQGKAVRCPNCKSVFVVGGSAEPLRLVEKHEASPIQLVSARSAKMDSMSAIQAGFDGEFRPVPGNIGYRLGITFVAFAMVLLPILYLSLIAGVVYLLYWHATRSLGPLKLTHSPRAIVFLYGGPLFAGAILLFFMVKPLLARSPKMGRVRALEPDKEPVLFSFVSRIAETVGAPEPRQIQVDCEVNASASFGNGIMGLFGRNLVLTIGLPLVGGFYADELAGVLAHELGHFSQGAGMRLSYLVRSINNWFMRVVYERDEWDEGLVRYSEENSSLAPIFWLALFGIFISRVILWVFMIIGHALSCFLLRHLEYDADRYEVRLVGSSVFEETFRRLAALEVASNAAHAEAAASWSKERLPDDLPALVLFHTQRIPPKLSRLIEKDLKKSTTGFFDSHPCYRDRVDNARREETSGIFHLEEPATILFSDYDKLSHLVTKDFFRQMLGRNLKRATFFSIKDAKELAGETKESRSSI